MRYRSDDRQHSSLCRGRRIAGAERLFHSEAAVLCARGRGAHSLRGIANTVAPLHAELIFGRFKSQALARTPLMEGYIGAEKVLMARLSLIGRFREVPEELFPQAAPRGACWCDGRRDLEAQIQGRRDLRARSTPHPASARPPSPRTLSGCRRRRHQPGGDCGESCGRRDRTSEAHGTNLRGRLLKNESR